MGQPSCLTAVEKLIGHKSRIISTLTSPQKALGEKGTKGNRFEMRSKPRKKKKTPYNNKSTCLTSATTATASTAATIYHICCDCYWQNGPFHQAPPWSTFSEFVRLYTGDFAVVEQVGLYTCFTEPEMNLWSKFDAAFRVWLLKKNLWKMIWMINKEVHVKAKWHHIHEAELKQRFFWRLANWHLSGPSVTCQSRNQLK